MSRLLWIVLLVPGLLAGLARAQDAPLDDDVDIVIPQQRVVRPVPRGEPVSITKVAASIDVRSQVATTDVTVTLTNPGKRPREAQVLLPVPAGATVRGFVMEGLGEKGVARILSREEARSIYRQIVSRTRDPGLLEFAGYNLMRSNVFPVPAEGSQAVTLTYEQVLPADADRVDYGLPRSEALNTTDVPWSIEMEIESARPISTVYSPSHELATERVSPTRVRVSVPASSARLPGSFRLSYLLESREGVPASLLAYPDAKLDGGGYFLLLAGLPAEKPEGAEAVKREVVLVLDRSGSMRGKKIEQAKEAARQVIEGLDAGEAFNIIDYSDSIELFAEEPVIKDDETTRAARAHLEGITARGGTNIHDALVEAVRQPVTEGRLPMVLFLTDGLPTVGERSEVAIREAVKSANDAGRRIFTFGVGYDVNAPLLDSVARASRGATTFVAPEEDVEVKVGQVFRRLRGPVLAAPEVKAVDASGDVTTRAIRELMPDELPDLFEGDQLVLLGQYTDEDERLHLELTGDYFGDERRFEFSFDLSRATTRNAFVPRLWATRKIAALITQINEAKANGDLDAAEEAALQELVDEIVHLSLRWGVLTEYTAFLATPEDVPELETAAGVPALGRAFREGARAEAGERLNRAAQSRAGQGAVKRQRALKMQRDAPAPGVLVPGGVGGGRSPVAGDDEDTFEAATRSSMRRVADQTFYRRGQRWIEASLFEVDDEKANEPEVTIDFGTEAYDELAERLIDEGRAALLTLEGEIYMTLDKQRVLVRGPKALESKD